MNTTDIALVGLASSVVTELFKFIPFLRKNGLTQALTAIVVVVVASFISNGYTFSFDNFVKVLVTALVSYKAVIEPLASTMDTSSQRD